MSVLHLTLKKKWFDMILSGKKKEEYRDIKPYWSKRLIVDPKLLVYQFKKFDSITFTNGYSKNARTMIVECNGIGIGKTRPKWSGQAYAEAFVISLGKIISTKNI